MRSEAHKMKSLTVVVSHTMLWPAFALSLVHQGEEATRARYSVNQDLFPEAVRLSKLHARYGMQQFIVSGSNNVN